MSGKKKERRSEANDDESKKVKFAVDVKEEDVEETLGNLRFEDPFSDEEEEEDSDEMQVHGAFEDEDEEEEDEEDHAPKAPVQVYIPGKGVDKDLELEVDNTAYEMLHRMTVEWPMLSFDFLPDTLGANRTRFPMTVFAIGGTEADTLDGNSLVMMRMSQLHRTKHDDDLEATDSDESDGGGEDDLDDDPELAHISVKHKGSVNRVRVMPQDGSIVASWSGEGKVHIWDLAAPLKALQSSPSPAPHFDVQPAHTVGKHKDEGFALDWSPVAAGVLASGDCANMIWRTARTEGGAWATDDSGFKGHTGSVEDIQWSPSEAAVFASCSVDQTIRIWDARKKSGAAMSVTAAACDVNVIAWNRRVPYLLASGDDQGNLRVWDLRSLKSGEAVGDLGWHTEAVTSVEWCPEQPSVLAASSSDNQVTIWDMSVERDAEAEAQMAAEGIAIPDLPPQLIFIHQGQKDVKEVHWYQQCPGVLGTTSATGFDVFKTINT